MSAKYIAVLGCTLSTNNATARASIIDMPSAKALINNNGIYKTPLKVQVVGASQGSFTQTAPAIGNIISTAKKVKAENILVILEGDKTDIAVQCPAINPDGATTIISVTVKIEKAGQNKVFGA